MPYDSMSEYVEGILTTPISAFPPAIPFGVPTGHTKIKAILISNVNASVTQTYIISHPVLGVLQQGTVPPQSSEIIEGWSLPAMDTVEVAAFGGADLTAYVFYWTT